MTRILLSIMTLAAAPTLAQDEPSSPTVTVDSEAEGYVGGLAQGVLYRGGAQTDELFAVGLAGRYRALPSASFASHLYVDLDAAALVPIGGNALFGLTAVARAGLAFDRWAVALGLYASVLTSPTKLQLWPSITAVWHPSWWGFSLGVFDRPLAGFGHVDLDLGPFSVGYSAPLGADLGFKPTLAPGLALDVHLFGWAFQSGFQAGGTVGLIWRPLLSAQDSGATADRRR